MRHVLIVLLLLLLNQTAMAEIAENKWVIRQSTVTLQPTDKEGAVNLITKLRAPAMVLFLAILYNQTEAWYNVPLCHKKQK